MLVRVWAVIGLCALRGENSDRVLRRHGNRLRIQPRGPPQEPADAARRDGAERGGVALGWGRGASAPGWIVRELGKTVPAFGSPAACNADE